MVKAPAVGESKSLKKGISWKTPNTILGGSPTACCGVFSSGCPFNHGRPQLAVGFPNNYTDSCPDCDISIMKTPLDS